MATSYEIIYKRFLQKITDFNLIEIDDYSLEEMLDGWLKSSIVRARTMNSDLSKRDDEVQEFLEDLTDLDIEILALGMVNSWLDQYLNSTENVLQFIGGKEEKLKQLFAYSSLYSETVQCISLNCWNPLRAFLLQRGLQNRA